jgi:two-component system sensor histidine kinase UhpB
VFARPRGPALFWRVAIGNAAVLAAACTITAAVFSPPGRNLAVRELAVFAGGLMLMLALNLLLLRRALAPLRELTSFVRRIDPLAPGRRLEIVGGDSEAAELGSAFNEMLERLEEERRDSVRRALAAQEGERLRVAQELHDGVGQTLTGVVLQLGRVARDVPERSRDGVLEAQETARGSLEEVRRIARRLRPEALDDLGLASALRVLGERVAEHSGLDVAVHVQPGLPDFDPDAELVLYRVAQEALTNVARHSGAGRAEVRLELSGGRPRLEIDDDGKGLPSRAPDGGGVRGMRERAVLIGASLRLVGSPLGGTRVSLELP